MNPPTVCTNSKRHSSNGTATRTHNIQNFIKASRKKIIQFAGKYHAAHFFGRATGSWWKSKYSRYTVHHLYTVHHPVHGTSYRTRYTIPLYTVHHPVHGTSSRSRYIIPGAVRYGTPLCTPCTLLFRRYTQGSVSRTYPRMKSLCNPFIYPQLFLVSFSGKIIFFSVAVRLLPLELIYRDSRCRINQQNLNLGIREPTLQNFN